jgi:hypothetical protein
MRPFAVGAGLKPALTYPAPFYRIWIGTDCKSAPADYTPNVSYFHLKLLSLQSLSLKFFSQTIREEKFS